MTSRWLSLHLVLFSMMLVGCVGCGSKSATKPTKKETPAAKAPEPAPIPAATPPPAPVAERKSESAPQAKAPEAKAPPVKAADSKPAEGKRLIQAEGAADFTKGYLKGKSVEDWIAMLDSKNKDEVIEAIQVCQLAKSKKAVDKLNELSKSTDKEIADDAKFAISRINAPN
jgi:hypothetical protein